MKRIRAGESLLVTDRRKPVAVLSPLTENFPEEWLDALVADEVVKPPQRALNVKRFLAIPRAACGQSLTEAVAEDRDGR